jgi:hypothetical protein
MCHAFSCKSDSVVVVVVRESMRASCVLDS